MQCDGKQCNAMESNAMQWNVMQYSGMQCNTVECDAVECNVMQCFAIKCKARQWNDKPRRRKISKDDPILIINSAQCTGTSEFPISFTIDPYVSGSD